VNPHNLEQFAEWTARSGLISRSQLIEEAQVFVSSRQFDGRTLADHLVDAGLLTRWQSEKLLEGKYKGFFLGQFKLLDHIRNESLAHVYLAKDTGLNRICAFRVLPHRNSQSAETIARFQQSARTMAMIQHPSTPHVHSIGCESNIHFFTSELISGDTIQSFIERSGSLDFHVAAHLLMQAARALQHVHDKGIVLQSLGPQSISVNRAGTLTLHAFDWAISPDNNPLLVVSPDQNLRMVLDNAHYIAPETALLSVGVDHRADIYSLGCLFYFMLVGQPPFIGKSIANVLRSHQHAQPRRLVDLRPDTPKTLIQMCETMAAKSRERRFQGCDEIVLELNEWLGRN